MVTVQVVFCLMYAATLTGPKDSDLRTPDDARIQALEQEVSRLRVENARIDELESALQNIQARDDASWLSETRATQIRGVVHDVLADTATRSTLRDSGAVAGYDDEFFIASPDGNFRLNVKGYVQFRWILNRTEGLDDRRGFEFQHVKLYFYGHVIDPSWTYRVKANFGERGGDFGLEDAWIAHELAEGVKLQVGQFHSPWLQEELVGDEHQLAVNRSTVNQFFNQGYDQGIQIQYQTDLVRLRGFYGMGVGEDGISVHSEAGPDAGIVVEPPFASFSSKNTAWTDSPADYSFVARVEYKFDGEWSQFENFNSFPDSSKGVLAGVSAIAQRGNTNAGAFDGVTQMGVSADLTIDLGGANIFANTTWSQFRGGEATETANPWGFVVQGGVFVTKEIEPFVRYEYLSFDIPGITKDNHRGTLTSNNNVASIVTLGGNWFLNARVKFTMDFLYNFASLAGDGPNLNAVGMRYDNPGDRNQWAVRGQFQLLF